LAGAEKPFKFPSNMWQFTFWPQQQCYGSYSKMVSQ